MTIVYHDDLHVDFILGGGKKKQVGKEEFLFLCSCVPPSPNTKDLWLNNLCEALLLEKASLTEVMVTSSCWGMAGTASTLKYGISPSTSSTAHLEPHPNPRCHSLADMFSL